MLVVDIWRVSPETGEAEDVGTISLVNGNLVGAGKGYEHILANRVYDPQARELVKPSEPERFLRLLNLNYSSSYGGVGQVREEDAGPQSKDFREADHPRGKPANAGQFTSKPANHLPKPDADEADARRHVEEEPGGYDDESEPDTTDTDTTDTDDDEYADPGPKPKNRLQHSNDSSKVPAVVVKEVGAKEFRQKFEKQMKDSPYVECYAGVLDKIYASLGFKEQSRSSFNRDYAAPNWNYERFGTPDYVTMKL